MDTPIRYTPNEVFSAIFPGLEVYIVLESEDPPAECRLPGAAGCTGRTMDLILRDWLTLRGEWRGRRPAMFIADKFIREESDSYADGDAEKAIEIYNYFIASVVSHECGHIAESEIDYSEPTATRMEFAASIAAYSAIVATNTSFPPFFGHSGKFVRLAIHAAHRAAKDGYSFPIDYLFRGEAYGLAEPSDFEYRMDTEVQNLERESLFDICKFRPRYLFVDLWQRCVNYWIDQQPQGAPGIELAKSVLEINQEQA